jgi:hypothetical protein
MSYALINRPEVRTDIINATEYYKKINPELAKQFLFRLKEAKAYMQNTQMVSKRNIKM